jgi:hypothetical protein
MKQAIQIILFTILAFAAPVVLVFAVLAALFVNPFSNSSPPPIAEGQITEKDWHHWDDGGRKLTAVLTRRFPIGTNEATLKSTLLAQGFHFAKLPPPENCVPPGQSAPVGVIFYHCLSPDRKKALERTLEYIWGRFPCSQSLLVEWSVDDRGEIANVQGYYHGVCL